MPETHICFDIRPPQPTVEGSFARCSEYYGVGIRCPGTRAWAQPLRRRLPFPPACPARSRLPIPGLSLLRTGVNLMLSRSESWSALGFCRHRRLSQKCSTSTDSLTLHHRITTHNDDTAHTSKAERGRGKQSSYFPNFFCRCPVHRSAGRPPRLILRRDQASRSNRPSRPVRITNPAQLQAQGRVGKPRHGTQAEPKTSLAKEKETTKKEKNPSEPNRNPHRAGSQAKAGKSSRKRQS